MGVVVRRSTSPTKEATRAYKVSSRGLRPFAVLLWSFKKRGRIYISFFKRASRYFSSFCFFVFWFVELFWSKKSSHHRLRRSSLLRRVKSSLLFVLCLVLVVFSFYIYFFVRKILFLNVVSLVQKVVVVVSFPPHLPPTLGWVHKNKKKSSVCLCLSVSLCPRTQHARTSDIREQSMRVSE